MIRPPPEDEAALEAWLESIRRSLDLRLDAEGRFWHAGEPFQHARLSERFHQGVDTHPKTGEPILRIGAQWCYLAVDDTAFFVRRLRPAAGELWAWLNNTEQHPVPPEGFEAIGERTYVQLTAHRRARLTRDAQHQLGPWLVEGPAGLAVRVAGRDWPVRVTG